MKQRKSKAPTAEALTAARQAHQRESSTIAQLQTERERALLDGADHGAVSAIDRKLQGHRRAQGIEADRIQLLERRAAEELRERQVQAQSDLIGRVADKFKERGRAIAELAELLAACVATQRKVLSANRAINAAWPWSSPAPVLLGPRMLGSLISSELYRISGAQFAGGGIVDDAEQPFPGSECPTPFSDTRPSSVKPLVEAFREASEYGLGLMRETPIRSLPPAPPPAAVPPAAPPAAVIASSNDTTDAPSSADQSIPNAESERVDSCEFRYLVDFVHLTTREERTEEITFTKEQVDESSLDGLGPTGPRGRDVAMRAALDRVPSEFAFAGKPNSIRFDMAHLIASNERNSLNG